MDLWELRERASKTIEHSLKPEREIVEETIALLEKVGNRLISVANDDGPRSTFAIICAQTVVKAFRLSLGAYSLCLNGLVVEGRPLIRLIFEAWQLLVYFREEPLRVQQALNGNLPTAGGVAKKIKDEPHSQLKGLRDYLNDNGSHISFEKDSLVSILIPLDLENAKDCLKQIFLLTIFVVGDAGRCLDSIGNMDATLADEIMSCHEKGLNLFGAEENKDSHETR